MSFSIEDVRERVPGLGSDDRDWAMASSAAALVAGLATRALVRAAWRRWRDEEPPENPASPDTGWVEAVAWTAAISMAVGTAQLMARRATAAALDSADA